VIFPEVGVQFEKILPAHRNQDPVFEEICQTLLSKLLFKKGRRFDKFKDLPLGELK
jgi:hypothetical protein